MNLNLNKKIINILIIFFLGIQLTIYIYNQKPLTENFSQKKITVENFSSIVLSKSGINKIGSEKLNKVDENNIFLEGQSYLENKDYKIYGKNININLPITKIIKNYYSQLVNKGYSDEDTSNLIRLLKQIIKPVFVDIQDDIYNIDPVKIEQAISSNTGLIMPVHSLGCPADMEAIMKIAEERNICVFEDCCEAHGSALNNK